MHLRTLLAALAAATSVASQAATAPTPPNLTLLYTMNAVIGDRFSLGRVPSGEERVVVPIIGGTFEGRMMKGEYRLIILSQPTLHRPRFQTTD